MATISITDTTGLTADLNLRDDSVFAKAKGIKMALASVSPVGVLASPIDRANFSKGTFGATFAEPSLLVEGAATFAVNAGVCGALSVIRPADLTLFGDDGVSAAIPVANDEYWVGIEIDGTLGGSVSAAADGFGVGVRASAAVSFSTYSRVKATANSFPPFKDCIGTALDNYSVACSAAAIRRQPAGTVNVADIAGTVTFSGSYSLPLSVNALASANLPFNYKIEVAPSATLAISGQIAITGDFVVRSHKVSDTELQLGVYKKKGTTLTAAITASSGIGVDVADTDLLSRVLAAAVGGAKSEKSGISPGDAAAFESVLQASLDRSVSIALNLACSASKTDEAAVLYSIDLSGGDATQTDTALASALRGDWTQLDRLLNARAMRNVVKTTHEFQHKLTINLLGVYNAASVADFVRSSTILHDENGAVVITDKATASRIATAQTPYAADADKLRSVLADSFLATVTYSAAASVGLKTAISASQTHFLYDRKLTRQEMTDAILLGRQLGLVPSSDWTETLAANPLFNHARVNVAATYNRGAALRLFFVDPATRSTHSQVDLERIGRATMLALIDPGDPAGEIRRSVLANDQIWTAMNTTGAVAGFRTIPGLSGLSPTGLGDVSADWIDVRWWADSMFQIGNQLGALISAIEASRAADPTTDADFMKNRDKVAATLAAVTRNAHAAFVGGWGLAVLFALSRSAAAVTMDIGWEGVTRHYETPRDEARRAGSQA